jgi:hypothetical protein
VRLVLLAVRVMVWWIWVFGEVREGLAWVLEVMLALVLPPR